MGGNKPHTLFAGMEESAELRRLQSIHERIAQVLGLPAEQRKFVPHVTLARLGTGFHGLHRFVASHNLYRSRFSRLTVSCYSRRGLARRRTLCG